MASISSSSASWTSPGAGITGGYDGDSETLRTFIVFSGGLAMYNACELITIIFLTFKHFQGMYFWSLLVSTVGIIPYALGFLLKFMNVTTAGQVKWLSVVLLTVGWYAMVTGQALVLWSRLHLIVTGDKGDKVVLYTKCMIVVNAVILHVPTTVLTFGSNGSVDTRTFEAGYNIMEKIQMIGFFLQEVTLSSIYIVETVKILRTSLQPGTRETMKQLVLINVVIILSDLGLLGLECASLYILEILLKGVIYSIKLKLEFAILGKLVKFVGGTKPGRDLRNAAVGFITTDRQMSKEEQEMNVHDFVSESLASRRKSLRVQGLSLIYDMARFEHVEEVSTLYARSPRDSISPCRERGV